jgi:DnaJ-domain-containing protein 1
MTDEALTEALAQLGIGPDTLRAVLLLPLVQVAWADGRIQQPERSRIQELARGFGLARGQAWERWLESRPDDATLELGRRVLAALALRHRGGDPAFRPEVLEDVEQHCLDVARSAGGLWGIAFSVDAREREALAQIGAALHGARRRHDEDLPEPDGGSFEDL